MSNLMRHLREWSVGRRRQVERTGLSLAALLLAGGCNGERAVETGPSESAGVVQTEQDRERILQALSSGEVG
ncbi:MAG: hypothetical protein ACKPJD_19510, partial [Planctomycetaceae bacterium]